MDGKGTMIVGLTGQTGAGKSTISRMFSERGIAVVDADVVARDTIENSKDCLMDLVLEFTTDVLRSDGTLNRQRLAEICFSDKQKLRRLNQVTFPYIIHAIEDKLKEAINHKEQIVVLDAPTLYESGMDKRCHRVIAVLADRETRLQRIIQRDEMTLEAAQRRVNAQNDDSFYTSRVNYVLRNDEDLNALRFGFVNLAAKLDQMAIDGSYLEPEDPQPQEEAAQGPMQEGELEELQEQAEGE